MKKKLSLKLDELNVETFATGDARDPRGTVHGHISKPACDTDLRGDCNPSIPETCPPVDTTCGHAISCAPGLTCPNNCEL
ncbi:MAG TPA: hypothetical protein VFQ39_01855 [Longimicrobium sp.]|nr:hypothetical protein [Longimicrobium sp.]